MGPEDTHSTFARYAYATDSTAYWDSVTAVFDDVLGTVRPMDACEQILAVVKSTHWGLHHYGD